MFAFEHGKDPKPTELRNFRSKNKLNSKLAEGRDKDWSRDE